MKLLNAYILDAINRAPSAHNTQPWLVRFGDNSLELFLNEKRMISAIDPENIEALHAVGAVLENIILTLNHLNMKVDYSIANELSFNKAIVKVQWHESKEVSGDSLYLQIPLRRTARDAYINELVAPQTLNELRGICQPQCELKFLTKQEELNSIRSLVTEATLTQFEDKEVASELYEWLRFSRRKKEWFRDGLNAECMAWSGFDTFMSKVLLKPKVLSLLSKIKLSSILFGNNKLHSPFAPVISLLVLKNHSIQNRVEAGRSLQRIWLKASEQGLVTHPISAAVDVEHTRGLVKDLFEVNRETPHVILFRLGRTQKITRSHRLPVDFLLK